MIAGDHRHEVNKTRARISDDLAGQVLGNSLTYSIASETVKLVVTSKETWLNKFAFTKCGV